MQVTYWIVGKPDLTGIMEGLPVIRPQLEVTSRASMGLSEFQPKHRAVWSAK